ncbi:hypothetical protein O181_002182 [Austropuccinia psidii MF-1]|uniref:histidine kinase n=1 Tax=Austropuccinia psidii MF-1 TaxID=1389203 RepID=A0A9Q3BCB1_9BASI|nr:hypothetical protein [Austropuccinia psidii MF-1]
MSFPSRDHHDHHDHHQSSQHSQHSQSSSPPSSSKSHPFNRSSNSRPHPNPLQNPCDQDSLHSPSRSAPSLQAHQYDLSFTFNSSKSYSSIYPSLSSSLHQKDSSMSCDGLISSSIELHPTLKSFFSNSSQLVFAIPAKPLFNALCGRCHIGKNEDPEEAPPPSTNLFSNIFSNLDQSQWIPYPHVTGKDAEAGRGSSLGELLRPVYCNPAAETLAKQILRPTQSKQNFSSDSNNEYHWDMMKLLSHKDLSKWLDWLRDILHGSQDGPSTFRTNLRQSPQHKSSDKHPHRKRSLNQQYVNNEIRQSSKSSERFVRSIEIIMTATVLDTKTFEPFSVTDNNSSEPVDSNHLIICSAIILHPPILFSNLSFPNSPSDRRDHTTFFYTDYFPQSPLKSASQPSVAHSNTSQATIHELNQGTTSPKRLKKTFFKPNHYPTSKPYNPAVSLLSPPNQNPQFQFQSTQLNPSSSNDWADITWLSEKEAIRVVSKANRRKSNSRPLRVSFSTNMGKSKSSPLSTPVINNEVGKQGPSLTLDDQVDTIMIDGKATYALSFGNLKRLNSSSQLRSLNTFSQNVQDNKKDAQNDITLFEEQVKSSSLLLAPAQQTSLHDNDGLTPAPLSPSLTRHCHPLQTSPSSSRHFHSRSPPESTISSQQNSHSKHSSISSSHRKLDNQNLPIDSFRQSLMISPVGRLIVNFDWTNTPLGSMEHWSPTLRSMVNLILTSPYRMSLLWGEECVMLYNDAYVKTCGRKHPGLLGQSGSEGWAELWNDLGDVADSVLKGDVYTVYDSLLFFDRDPQNPAGIRKEECYHSFSWIPVRGPTGRVEGIFNPSFETTSRVIAERRLGTLRDLVQITLMSRNRNSYKQGCLESFSKNPYDLSFVIMYSCQTKKAHHRGTLKSDDGSTELSTGQLTLQLALSGTVGVPKGHPSATEQHEFTIQLLNFGPRFAARSNESANHINNVTENESLSISSGNSYGTMVTEFTHDKENVWPLQEACTLRKPIYISDLGTRTEGFELRGWMDQPKSAVVMPVSTNEEGSPLAVIVFGLSPRLYWSETYALFLNLLTRQFSTGLSTVISHEEEAQRLEDLAALDRAKTTFFTNISHELRTPLTLIVGPISEILDSGHDLSFATRDKLKMVERNTQRLINLVNQLLDLSRFEAGKMTVRFRATNLSKMTTDLASLFRSAMIKNGLELNVDCQETFQQVWVDHDFFEKVIFNLLSNSMKFTPRNGQVTLRVWYDVHNCYLVCSDTGIGIKEEELPRIFERFYRVEESSNSSEGTGIGLVLVQDIIKLHHGLLEVESHLGAGTKFTITLRLGDSHLPEDLIDYSPENELEKHHDRVIARNARRWILGGPEPIQSSHMAESSCSSDNSHHGLTDHLFTETNSPIFSTVGSTILIADDNSDMRFFLKGVLSRYFKVLEASNGQEAYESAKIYQPDMIISDVMMPGMDGFQLLKGLKSDSDTGSIPIILLSARAESESRIEGLAEGADDYLAKPFEAKELLARINTHLQVLKMRQRLENAVMTRTQLLRESEQKFRDLYRTFEAISMLSPVGIIQWDINGQITFANNAFRSQSKLSSDKPLREWTDQIHPKDREQIQQIFNQLFQDQQSVKGEFRWKDDSWCFYELSAYYQTNHHQLGGYLGSITDVTERKESERKQLEAAEARARDAEESRRQQEAFIDMTSHEIRNPLHGIHQAAELLYTSLKSMREVIEANHQISGSKLQHFRDELEENIDAVESIQLCTSHQSRIADDIINVSKLSMGLLTTVKTDFDLVTRVREVLSMYLIEAQQKKVDLKLEIGEGLEGSQYISADPNRLAQVTINFLSNALRYTSNSAGLRRVTVRVDLFTKCPGPRPNVRRIGSMKVEPDHMPVENLVFASVSVQDTARGLSPEELATLFSRFAQANPTQDQYGGSGLGLYVSHRLIENHGGFIEVSSTKGVGSVFSFVVPAKRGSKLVLRNGPAEASMTKGQIQSSLNDQAAEMQPVSAFLPIGAMGISSRLSSPECHSSSCLVSNMKAGSTPLRLTHEEMLGSGSKSEAIGFCSNSQPVHVLVVEDNLINIKMIRRHLIQKGYIVSVAIDGRKALDLLYADINRASGLPPIDIVLMDIQMPVMDGLQAITELRAAEKSGKITKHYPVIAVTGNARKEQTEQCLASGFDNVCVKPYKIDDVQNRMENLLAKFRIGDP